MSPLFEAAQALSVVRAAVCKALRAGAGAEELAGLLAAETRAMEVLTDCMIEQEHGRT